MSKKTVSQHNRKRQAQSNKSQPTWLLLIAGAGLVVILIAAYLVLNGGLESAGLTREITVAEAAAKHDAGVFMLDVREPDEWNQVHIPGATLIPLGQLEGRVSELPSDQEIVVVCRSGNRSQQGRDILLEAGFEQVTSMAGGMNEWAAAGYPTVSGP